MPRESPDTRSSFSHILLPITYPVEKWRDANGAQKDQFELAIYRFVADLLWAVRLAVGADLGRSATDTDASGSVRERAEGEEGGTDPVPQQTTDGEQGMTLAVTPEVLTEVLESALPEDFLLEQIQLDMPAETGLL